VRIRVEAAAVNPVDAATIPLNGLTAVQGVDAVFDAAVLGYPALDAVRAHERLEAGGIRGRLVLVP
jgi:hypothetical protein